MIIADGFFEWRQVGSGKVPYYIKLKNEQPFAFAGIYSINKNEEGKEYAHFAIITVEPNELVKEIHNRMPAILEREDELIWLKENDPQKLLKLLKPYPADRMKGFPISKLVNTPVNDSPEVIYPLEHMI